MAMDKNRLGAALWAAVKATTTFNPTISPVEDAKGLALWTTVADQIIQEVIGHSVVTVNSFTASVSGVQSGGSSSGNLTGTGTGTITS